MLSRLFTNGAISPTHRVMVPTWDTGSGADILTRDGIQLSQLAEAWPCLPQVDILGKARPAAMWACMSAVPARPIRRAYVEEGAPAMRWRAKILLTAQEADPKQCCGVEAVTAHDVVFLGPV